MWNRILTLFSATPSPKQTLRDILADKSNREFFLGVQRNAPPSPEKMIKDVDHVINYANSNDYAIWAQETWSLVLDSIDKLSDPQLESWQIDFYRGRLASHIEALRISYKAIHIKQDAVNISKQQ